ncbi:transposase [Enterobacter chengduensis]|nr:transposase [Enterobacter kobei]QEL38535.1 transposase [Enterobacter chengduensis]RSK59107.1 transposase [Enterobacter chengduensis]
MHGERTCHSFIYFSGHDKTALRRTKTTKTNLILITLPVLYRMNQAKAMFQECNNEYIKPRSEQRRKAHQRPLLDSGDAVYRHVL